MRSPDYQPIENYGVIGNLQTVALIGMDASMDFLCFPRFDSPSVFAALLDTKKGGYFQVAPVLDGSRVRQLYLPDSNILLTRFLSEDGVAEISDFMPVAPENPGTPDAERPPARVVRRAKTVRGEVRFRMNCQPRFDYARASHKVEQPSANELLFRSDAGGGGEADRLALRLRAQVPLRRQNGDGIAEFTLRAGESTYFVLEEARPGEPSACDTPDFDSIAFKETLTFWRRWIGRSTYRGRWREVVNRSALVLKLLTSQKYGSIVAAPTFSLPESLGSGRNWDYRYTWIRDASFTLYGLSRLGFYEEAAAFMRWVEERCSSLPESGALQIMYGIDGHPELTEHILPNLEGYRRSAPVRIGNGAYNQLQLDIYGELMDSVYIYNKYGEPISHDLWNDLTRLLNWVDKNWRRPDEGIWEVRGGTQEFLYSRVMCWAALDRGVRLALKRSFPAPLARWIKTRDTIYADIFKHFWDDKLQAFIQARGRPSLDASSLLMPLIKFIGPTDPRWLSTLRAIEHHLVDDSLVYRYRDEDGLGGKEGTFCMCSFWYIECLSRSGDPLQARFLFEKMLGYANHLGLYAEELGPAGEHLGNFPQAFTHLALISAAFEIDRRLDERPAGRGKE